MVPCTVMQTPLRERKNKEKKRKEREIKLTIIGKIGNILA